MPPEELNNLEPILEAQTLQNEEIKANGEETNALLQALIAQGESDNDSLLEARIAQADQHNKELKEALKESTFNFQIDGVEMASITGPQGEKGDKGDKGDDGSVSLEMPDGTIEKKEGKIVVKGLKGDKGDKGDKGEKGADGKDGKDGKVIIGANGRNGIDGINGVDGVDGKDGSPDTAKQIKKKLESLKDEDRLDIKALKGIDKIEKDIKKAGQFVQTYQQYDVNGTLVGNGTRLNLKQGSGVTLSGVPTSNGVDVTINASGGGAVDSVNGQTGVVVLDTGDIAEATDANYVSDAQLSIIANTTASFTTADETKLDNITVTQAVNLDTMESDIAALANGMVYKGNWDASAGTFPGAGVAQTGWFYTVSVGGTVDSVVFVADDRLVATTDNASATVYAGNWTKLDATDAVTSIFSRTGNVVSANGDYTASQITNVPAGNISAVTVQTALNELDNEKQPLDTQLTSLAGLSYGSNALKVVRVNAGETDFELATISSSGATTALDNLASVAINTSLISDTDNTDNLGSTLIKWANLFVTTIGATATRVTKGWFTDIESTNIPTVGGTPVLSSLTAPQFTTVELGHATDTTLSRASAGVVAVEGKTLVNLTDGGTFAADISVPDEAYGSSWNGSVEVPTKNAVYDKIQSGPTLLASGTFNTTATSATFTADAGTDVITSAGHNLQDGDKVVLTTTGTIPAGLSLSTGYYVRDKTTDTFKLSSTPYRTAIDITDAGSGTHTWTFVPGVIKVTIAARTFLKVYFRGLAPTAAGGLNVVINQDANETDNNYGSKVSTDGGAGSANNDTFRWVNILGGSNTNEKNVFMEIQNQTSMRKMASWHGSTNTATSTAATIQTDTVGAGIWANTTDQITEILFHLDSTGGFASGSILYAYGND